MKPLSVAIAQLNFTVGHVEANLQKIIDAARHAEEALDCDAIIFPELAITGYPPEDLLFRTDFLARSESALGRLTEAVGEIFVVVGHPLRKADKLFNAASVLHRGQSIAVYCKRELPNFGVFDEKRYFSAGASPCVIDINGTKVGLTICEDIWHAQPVADSAAAGAEVIFNLNASPYDFQKAREREERVVGQRAREAGLPIVYVNLVGGQDELVFDGGSFVSDAQGRIAHRSQFFAEALDAVVIEEQEPGTAVDIASLQIGRAHV